MLISQMLGSLNYYDLTIVPLSMLLLNFNVIKFTMWNTQFELFLIVSIGCHYFYSIYC